MFMKHLILLGFLILLIFAFSCQKENEYVPAPPETITINLDQDTTIPFYNNQSFILDASTGDSLSIYNWSWPYSTNLSSISVTDPYNIGYSYVDIYTDTAHLHYSVYFIYMNTSVYYPNSFSPNYDGITDYWFPKAANIDADNFLLKIYDEEDHLLFKSDQYFYNSGWDGTVEGELCPEGYYYYVAKYKTINGEKHKDSGMLQLIR
jgi:gliding motility-associated-like protein